MGGAYLNQPDVGGAADPSINDNLLHVQQNQRKFAYSLTDKYLGGLDEVYK